jgi:ABC-type multidrug transport system permease subunit
MIGFRRFLAVLHARNIEFIRDRSTLGWNILLPLLLVLGLAFVFSGEGRPMFKVGVLPEDALAEDALDQAGEPFLGTRHVQFVPQADERAAVDKVARHQLDMLLDLRNPAAPRYWVNSSSPRGYLLERMLGGDSAGRYAREVVAGREVRYVDWLVPGILGMNMMFSCLFGVGYVIVRYRKSGFLKRLNASPLRAFEFLAAQVTSRLVLIMAITVAVFVGTDLVLDFYMMGSYADLAALTALGAVSMISLGLLVASRVTSEELAGGVLNLLSWPMMVMSGVWFSMEGTPDALQAAAKIFPLTHLLDGARAIMLDGRSLVDIWPTVAVLAAMSALFLGAGSYWFKWKNE